MDAHPVFKLTTMPLGIVGCLVELLVTHSTQIVEAAIDTKVGWNGFHVVFKCCVHVTAQLLPYAIADNVTHVMPAISLKSWVSFYLIIRHIQLITTELFDPLD